MYSICHAQKDLGLSLGTRHTAFSILTRAFQPAVRDVWWRLQFRAVHFMLRNPGFPINATIVESLSYIPLLTDDIKECNALHNHENAVENFGSPMELMLMKKMLELPRCWILLSVKPKVKFSVVVFYYGNQVTFVGGSKPAKLLWTLVIDWEVSEVDLFSFCQASVLLYKPYKWHRTHQM